MKMLFENQLPDSKMLGDTLVICFSKSGIINTNSIGIFSYLVVLNNNLDTIDVEGSRCIPKGFLKKASKRIPDLHNRPVVTMTAKIATLCNDSEFQYDYENRQINFKGELLEACLKAFAEKIGHPDEDLEINRSIRILNDRYTEVSDYYNRHYPKVRTYKFSRERKLMSVIVGKDTLLVKGPLMIILDRCNRYLDDSDGIVKEMNTEIINKIKIVNKMWSGGHNHYSCIGFAYKDAPDFES